MRFSWALTFCIVFVTGSAKAWMADWGPFAADQHPDFVSSSIASNGTCLQTGGYNVQRDLPDGSFVRALLTVPGHNILVVWMSPTGLPVRVKLDLQEFSFQTASFQTAVTDLNGDGIPDVVMNIPSMGCGLMSWYSEQVFFVSSPTGRIATWTCDFDFDTSRAFLRFKKDGPVYLMLATLVRSGAPDSTDDCGHSFWVNRLYRFNRSGALVSADGEVAGFPRWVRYLARPNHEEEQILKPGARARLLANVTSMQSLVKKQGILECP